MNRLHYVPARQRETAHDAYRSDIERAAWRQSLADRMLITADREARARIWEPRL